MNQSARDFCLRSIAYLKIEIETGNGPELELSHQDSPVLRSIGYGLLCAYLVDDGDKFFYVQHRHLDEAELTEDELHERAIANLAVIAENNAEVRQYGNRYIVFAGGNFEASMILLDEFWSVWYADLAPNGFIAAFPARDILAFGDVASPAAISELRATIDRVEGIADHPLSSSIFRRVNSAWEPISAGGK